MVLKIARPELSITLLEATGKKVGFIQHVIDELALSEITAMHGRAEEAAHDPAHRARYDLATARAVASLPALIELTMPFLRKGGIGIFPKGAEIADELREGAAAASELGCAIESADALPPADGDLVTRLVIAVKIELTPIRYPRRAGVPVKDPLGRAHR
jgi:16S rRNA (guanine527-N7)-methyltransferase